MSTQPSWTDNTPDGLLYPFRFYFVLDDEGLGTVRLSKTPGALREAYHGGAAIGEFLTESAAKRRVEASPAKGKAKKG